MTEYLAEFLDEISQHIERELAKVPAPVADALLHGDSPLSTSEMLRILARSPHSPARDQRPEEDAATHSV